MGRHAALSSLTLALLPALLCTLPVQTTTSADELFDLSLEELAQVRVSVVSLRAETMVSSPAIVSGYDMAAMADLGLRSLRDVLNVIPGVVVNTTSGGTDVVQIRGLGESDNQKVLFLVNEVPYWMPASGDIPLLGIPYEAIERVEVIRGPGSVIYGTNASAGVIKVVTRKSAEGRAALAAGSDDRYQGSGYFGTALGDEGQLSVALELGDSHYHNQIEDSFNPANRPATEDLDGRSRAGEQLASLLVSLDYRDWALLFQFHDLERQDIFSSSVAQPARYDQRGWLLSAARTFRLQGGELVLFTDLNRYYRDVVVTDPLLFFGISGRQGALDFADDGEDNQRWRSGLRLSQPLGEGLTLLAGAEYEERSTGNQYLDDGNGGDDLRALGFPLAEGQPGLITLGANELDEASGYAQLDYQADPWRLVVGARYSDNSLAGSKLTPRASLVYQLDPRSSLKLLYAEGYNAPTFKQLHNVDFFGNPRNVDVAAERTQSTDLAYTLDSGRWLLVANLYSQRISDLITPAPGGGYRNGGGYERWGGELDLGWRGEGLTLAAGLGYVHQGNQQLADDETAWFASQLVANMRGSWQFAERQQLAAVAHSMSPRAGLDSAHWLDLSYQYRLEQFTLFASVTNLLGETIAYPALDNLTAVVTIPENEQRWLVGVSSRF